MGIRQLVAIVGIRELLAIVGISYLVAMAGIREPVELGIKDLVAMVRTN